MVGACLLVGPTDGEAKNRTLGRDELIRKADIIAVVGIDSVSKAEVSATPRGAVYRQAVRLRVVQVLKGQLADDTVLHADMDYACDTAAFVPRLVYLAFLWRRGPLIVPVSWHESLSVVGVDGRINWFTDAAGLERRYQPINDVVALIRHQVARTEARSLRQRRPAGR
jgi:hypothetical protein